MLKKRNSGAVAGGGLVQSLANLAGGTIDRRRFLERSGLAAGGLAAAAGLSSGMMRKASAATPAGVAAVELKKTICTHCSVGCTVMAEVQNGVWIGQEPGLSLIHI